MICNRCDRHLLGNEYKDHWKECSRRRIVVSNARTIPKDNLAKAQRQVRRNRKLLNQYRIDELNKNKQVTVGTSWVYTDKRFKRLRYPVLKANNFKCCACNSTEAELHIDHIKPVSKYPELAFDINNLQVLCKDCNLSKSNKFEDDLR